MFIKEGGAQHTENLGLGSLTLFLPLFFDFSVFLLQVLQWRKYLITFTFYKFDFKNIDKIIFDFSCLCKLIEGENAGVVLSPVSESNLLKLENYIIYFSA